MLETRTNNLTDITGCIEDRTFQGSVNGELNQVPGADLFFSYLRDVLSVLSSDTPTHPKFADTVLSDVERLGSGYAVHNDADHGSEFDGCGFAAQIADITADLSKNINDILATLNMTDYQISRAKELSAATGKLLGISGYFSTIGGDLVEKAVRAGANLITYVGDHTAAQLTVDKNSGSTYDSAKANANYNDLNPSFNVDTNYAREKAEAFGLNADDAELIAELLSMATVRVLSGGAITEASYVSAGEATKAREKLAA